ncbi:hypothetical protein Btru_012008 [Bulinus truncatus]|nr:hypothetical protein Btru_012008 [Bulinus truncatus]
MSQLDNGSFTNGTYDDTTESVQRESGDIAAGTSQDEPKERGGTGVTHERNDLGVSQSRGKGEKVTTDADVDDPSLDEDDDDEVDLSCGLWRLRTNIFGSWFSNLYMFAAIAGLSSMFSFMARRIVSVQLESLEKQFKIDNTYAGLFETTAKVGLLVTILFSGHFTRKVHMPVIIGIAGIIQGILLMAPAFLQLADPYTLPNLSNENGTNTSHVSDKYMCGANIFSDNTSSIKQIQNSTEEPNKAALVVVLVAQTIKGIAESFHTAYLPTLYMDNNMVDKSKMSLFLGIRYFIDGLSGPIGTEINGILTEIPIDLKDTKMSSKDGRFVAAWWLAFLIFGAGLVVTSFPLLLFPKTLISERQRRRMLRLANQKFSGGEGAEEADTMDKKKTDNKTSVPRIVIDSDGEKKSLNSHEMDTIDGHPRYITDRKGSSVSVDTHLGRKLSLFPPLDGPTERKLSLTGNIVFDQPAKPDQPASTDTETASFSELLRDLPKSFLRLVKNPIFVLGIVDITVISIPLTGMYMFRNVYMTMEYNVPMSEVALASSITSAVGTLSGTVFSSWLTTKANSKLHLQWIIMATYLFQVAFNPMFLIFGCDNKPVYGDTGTMGIPMNATADCDCTYSQQLLSCGDDGNNYLSPCYAGCKEVTGNIFTKCGHMVNSSFGTTVTPGVCSSDCHNNFLLYAILHGVQYMVEGATMIPRWLLILRIVDPQDRGFATSFYIFFYTITSIPSSNIFGKLIDNACFIWDGDLCHLYDRDIIRYLMSGLDVGVNVVSILTNLPTLILLWLEHRRMQKEKKKKKEEGEEDGKKDQTENINKDTETHRF